MFWFHICPPCNQDFLNYKGSSRYFINYSVARAAAYFQPYVNTFFKIRKKDPYTISDIEILNCHLNLMTLHARVTVFFCISGEPKSGFARDLGDCLQSRNMPFGTSGDPACFIDSPLIDHPQQSQLFLSLRLSKIVSVLFR